MPKVTCSIYSILVSS